MTAIPVCRHRGPESPRPGSGRYFCDSPAVGTADGTVSAFTCGRCKIADHATDLLMDAPGYLEMAGNLIGSGIAHLANGAETVSPRRHAMRLAECRECELNYGTADSPSCRKCGCNMVVKAWSAALNCPHPSGSRWEAADAHRADQESDGPQEYPEVVAGLLDPLPDPELKPQPKGWAMRPPVRNRHIAAVQSLADGPIPQPPPRSGRGIIMTGGGKYAAGIYVGLRMLRDTGCTLPVEVWHRGGREPISRSVVEGFGARLIDADAHAAALPPRLRPRKHGGWQSKSYAVIHSAWEEVGYIDADAYYLQDPTPMFDFIRRAPFAYWSETSQNVRHARLGLSKAQIDAVPPVQGGQWFMNVTKFWRELVIAYWLDQHADYAYSQGVDPQNEWAMYGDQDGLRVAMAYEGVRPLVIGETYKKGPIFLYGAPGYPGDVIVHRYEDKILSPPAPGPKWDDSLPGEARVRALYEALVPRGLPAATMMT